MKTGAQENEPKGNDSPEESTTTIRHQRTHLWQTPALEQGENSQPQLILTGQNEICLFDMKP